MRKTVSAGLAAILLGGTGAAFAAPADFGIGVYIGSGPAHPRATPAPLVVHEQPVYGGPRVVRRAPAHYVERIPGRHVAYEERYAPRHR